eukprot:COSAG06_NODE_13964_length_1201_cov_15.793103_1_plen_35_part_10
MGVQGGGRGGSAAGLGECIQIKALISLVDISHKLS